MSKSLGNTIDIFAPEDVIRKQIMSMVTDTKRILRTDPGRPEVCNVCQLHRSFGDDYDEIWDGERTARTGCVDTKKLLAERVLRALRRGPRALPRADGRPRPDRPHPRRGRRARPPDRRGDDGRGPREDGAAVGRPCSTRSGPAGRERRLVSAILMLGDDRPVLRRGQPGRRRRSATSATSCWRSSWPGCSPSSSARSSPASSAVIPRLPRVLATVLVYTRDRGRARLPRPGRRPGAVELDHPVRRIDAGDPRQHRHDRGAAPGLARFDRPRAGRPGRPGPCDPRQPRRRSRPS